MFRKIVNSQIFLSRALDKLLPRHYRIDGNSDFRDDLAGKYIRNNYVIYDVGGGKTPFFPPGEKAARKLTVIGLDIDPAELAAGPPGAYDEVICADISRFQGQGDADLAICRALLEHVRDTREALAALGSILKPGGRILLFVPSRNALFARINLLLPEGLKRKILFSFFPQARTTAGFPSFYDQCTPRDFSALAARCGLEVEEKRLYFFSGYFSFCFPFFFLWRLWVLGFHLVAGEQAAESFAMVLRKQETH